MADSTVDDVVSLLRAQHAQIEKLFLLVSGGTGQAKADAFDDLARLLVLHEAAEQQIVHPLTRTLPGDSDALIEEHLAEEQRARAALRVLLEGGVEADSFDEGIQLLRTSVLDHSRHEERYEFPRLRQHVPAERLRQLADAIRAAEDAAPTHPQAQ